MTKELDRHDILILSALNDDPRMPASKLGELAHLSRTAVSKRLVALRDGDVFEEQPQLVSYAALGLANCAFVEIYPGDMAMDQVSESLLGRPEVVRVCIVAGKPLFLVEVAVADMEHLDAFMKWAQALGHTETKIVFSDKRSKVTLKQRLEAVEKYRKSRQKEI